MLFIKEFLPLEGVLKVEIKLSNLELLAFGDSFLFTFILFLVNLSFFGIMKEIFLNVI